MSNGLEGRRCRQQDESVVVGLHRRRTGARVGAGLAVAAVALSAAGCSIGGTKTVTTTVTRTVTTSTTAAAAPCLGGSLVGTFNVVPGSAAAGQISYLLTLTNISRTACTVSGLPSATVEDASNKTLPTQVTGSPSATVVTLQPGDSATATARFSPDLTASNQGGTCQPKAHQLSVNPGVGTVEMRVKPETSVCDGTLNFTPYAKR